MEVGKESRSDFFFKGKVRTLKAEEQERGKKPRGGLNLKNSASEEQTAGGELI